MMRQRLHTAPLQSKRSSKETKQQQASTSYMQICEAAVVMSTSYSLSTAVVML